MKLLMENWRDYQEGPKAFYVSIEEVIPTEELGHGKDHDCPSKECDDAVFDKESQIMAGKFEPILVCKQKPLNIARLKDQHNGPKNAIDEPFYYVLDGHHRLEAAKRLGLRKVPVIRSEEANT
tara:strand:+ start:397 stop:765 length:369 start_codon:yes stop_codon:yes gene_type:complete